MVPEAAKVRVMALWRATKHQSSSHVCPKRCRAVSGRRRGQTSSFWVAGDEAG
jgi:hypothetical protein